ncbi:hypothetical protein [Paenibacillus sp. sgz302251]|uniref:hypothetical protein n=1 Tax=Paenibacillus sp. sgz302251 TaxID=3414493 RepID=UPI003C7AEEC4
MSNETNMQIFKTGYPPIRSVDGYWMNSDGEMFDIKEDMSEKQIKACVDLCKKLQKDKSYCTGDDTEVYKILQSKIIDLEKYL